MKTSLPPPIDGIDYQAGVDFLSPHVFDQPAVRGRITGDGYQVTDPSGIEWTVLLDRDGWEACPPFPESQHRRVTGVQDVDDLVMRIVAGQL